MCFDIVNSHEQFLQDRRIGDNMHHLVSKARIDLTHFIERPAHLWLRVGAPDILGEVVEAAQMFFCRDNALDGAVVVLALQAAHLTSELLPAETLAVEAAIQGVEELPGSWKLALLSLSMRRHGLEYPDLVAGCPHVLERERILVGVSQRRYRLIPFLVRLWRIGQWWDLPLALR
jgi:hypothetical protein